MPHDRSAPPSRRRHPLAALALSFALLTVAACSSSDSAGSSSSTTAGASSSTTSASTTTTAPPALPADRPIEVVVPSGYEKGTPAPLLVLLHGYGTTGSVQSAYLRLQAATEAKGMLYVFPDGTENAIGKQFWNATDACCAGPKTEDVDDSAYLSAVVADIRSRYDVDPKRIYFVGHSNGGFMSFRMACDHADVVAAIVSLEAATWKDPTKCQPSEGVATLQVHGTADRTIRYDGGSNTFASYPSAAETLKTWATYNGCDLTPDDPAPASHSIVVGLPPATVTSHSAGCEPGGHSELWTQPEGGHIPLWTKTFADQVVQFLLDHPKP